MPASINATSFSTEEEAGPIVQTIFVLPLMMFDSRL
jgi:hypothetical protein